jgi:predicted CXXCH cytochrome family protein
MQNSIPLFRYFLTVSVLMLSLNISAAEYVGSETCVNCHQDEFDAWQGSQHQLAMTHASNETVYGDFDNATFVFAGKTNRFFRKGEEFWVNIEGPDGLFHDYQIKYTFGVSPLQQYMVEFEDGRVQLIPFTWDARPKQEGGMRWYHLYPNMEKTDEFYWTNTGQNWNYMCADCHSTNIEKNFDINSNEYNTTWSEISVGCEACHGPGSEHNNWAALNKDKPATHIGSMGFDRDLSKAVKNWVYEEGSTNLQPESITPTQQVQVCAQCHSRRNQLSEKNDHVQGTFSDRYLLNLITPDLYHFDGQIYDEDYVYGSFLQTKMAEKGVVCSNCHEPHSAKLQTTEDAICLQCHIPTEYTPEKHAFHEAGTEAAKCTTCHMPETTYMQIDLRKDHSWSIPRPDLSKDINIPNVCTRCHEDKTNIWADDTLGKWFPNSKYRNKQHFSVGFFADSINHPESGKALSYVAQNHLQSDIIRAAALQRLDNHQSQSAIIALSNSVKNDSELIRLGTIRGSSSLPFSERWQLLKVLLADPVYAIRTEAASALAQYWQMMNNTQRQQLTPALNEYMDIQRFNSDRGFGQTNLGNIYRLKGEYENAIKAYQGAMIVEPNDEASYVNLADLYREQGKEILAFNTIGKGIKAQPKSATLQFSGGLSLLRQKKNNEAIIYVEKATEIAPENGYYWYVYGLLLENVELTKASDALNTAFSLSNNPDYLYARCDMLLRHKDSNARECVKMLTPYVPSNVIKQLQALY